MSASVSEYVNDIRNLGGEPPEGFLEDPYDMQIADLDDRLRKLIAAIEKLDKLLPR